MSSTVEKFELTREQAEFYEAKFVPALFAEWAPLLVEVAGVRPGSSVLDVACGTGIVARVTAQADDGNTVVGLDRSQAMLDVASRLLPEAEFTLGDAMELPFGESSFDAVLCQASLMFFPDPHAALAEMARVVTPGGTVGVQVWGRLESSPGYLAFVEVVAKHAGDSMGLLTTYFRHGDLEQLTRLMTAAGLDVAAAASRLGTMRYGSIDEFVTVEVESTPLRSRIDDETCDHIRADAREALHQFATDEGVALPIEGHLVRARKAA